MNCMKCGRELEAGQVFCAQCREHMSRHPVKPGTAVVLPPRKNLQATKKQTPKKKPLSAEEQNVLLKKHNRRLAYLLIAAIVIIALLGVISGYAAKQLDVQKLLGQNYSTIEQTEPSTESTTDTSGETNAPTE